MEYTKNYHLPQWVESDRIMMEDFNQMCRDMEAGLDSVKNEGSTEVSELAQSIQQLIGSGGFNCRVEMGSYIGNGKCGKTNAVELVCSFRPVLIVLGAYEHAQSTLFPCIMIRGIARSVSDNSASEVLLEWTDTGVKMWTEYDSPDWMNNEAGCEYFYVAFGY